MGRCNTCRRSPCNCKSSSSSSSNSGLSSISSQRLDAYKEPECPDLCISTEEARRRYEATCTDKKVRILQSYALDTYNLKYRPRVLEVPSKEYCTLDDALASLQENAGGYIIKLRPDGEYTMNASLCRTVDDLVIEGDCDPFAGMIYSRRCLVEDGNNLTPPPVQPFPLCRSRYSSILGRGPFDLVVNGSSIIVYGLSARGERDQNNDPCFDNICKRRVIMFSARGELIEAEATGRGNTITVNRNVPFTDIEQGPSPPGTYEPYRRRCSGFGFFFPPSVVIRGANNTSLNTLDSVKIIGVQLDLGPLFFFGALNGAAVLSNCWISNNVAFFSNVFCENPNVWTGLCYMLPAARGTMNNQAFVGPFAHLTVDASLINVNYSLFASAIHAVDCVNGGTLHMLGCEIVNCCLALSAYQGATVSIPDCRFCCNLYALYAAYQSRITSNPVSVPGQDATRVYASPWFIHNVILFIAAMNSFIIIPNARMRGNLIPGLIDGEVFTTLESIHIDFIGQKGSAFVYLPSASTPNPPGLGCATALSIPGALTEAYLANLVNANSWAVVTGSFIHSIVGESDVSVTAAESLGRLAADMGDDTVQDNPEVPF